MFTDHGFFMLSKETNGKDLAHVNISCAIRKWLEQNSICSLKQKFRMHPWLIDDLQLATHQWIQSTPYVCNEWILDGLLFMSNEIFLNKALQKLVPLTFTLILIHFESKLVKYSTRCQSLKTPRKSLNHYFWSENGTKVE